MNWLGLLKVLPANASPTARPRFVVKYEFTDIKRAGARSPNPRPKIIPYAIRMCHIWVTNEHKNRPVLVRKHPNKHTFRTVKFLSTYPVIKPEKFNETQDKFITNAAPWVPCPKLVIRCSKRRPNTDNNDWLNTYTWEKLVENWVITITSLWGRQLTFVIATPTTIIQPHPPFGII